MNKEFIKQKGSIITLNVTAGKIDSFRKQVTDKNTVRVYSDGYIGVAGSLGKPDEEELTRRATEALGVKIPYSSELDGALTEERHIAADIPEEDKFIGEAKELLGEIQEACPDFCITNKLSLASESTEYINSSGRHLTSSTRYMSTGLVFQARGSGNVFDASYGSATVNYDRARIVSECASMYKAFYKPVKMPEGDIPVILTSDALFETLLINFTAEMYASGASLISGKLDEELFSERLSLYDDRNPATAIGRNFFDAEGQISDGLRAPFIEKGRFVNVTASKNAARRFGVRPSKTSAAAYDGIPQAGLSGLFVAPTAESLAALVPDRAIFIDMMSGGETTPSGHFASPVQSAYLLEQGRLVGRLPEFTVSGEFFSMLGDDFIGAVHGELFEGSNLCAVKLKISE